MNKNQNEVFQEGLETIRILAVTGHGKVSISQILGAFPGMKLSDDQIKAIYQYLAEEGIEIEDYQPHDTRSMDLGEDMAEQGLLGLEEDLMGEQEKLFYHMYLEDLEKVEPLSSTEEESLIQGLLDGEEEARTRLTEGNLHWVLAKARKYAGRGVPLGDLIQEGNIALMLALAEYDGEEALGDFLGKEIDHAMKKYLKEQDTYSRAEDRMAQEANRVLELTKDMEEELGRAVTMEELSAKMGIPASRIEEVVRTSAHAVENAKARKEILK